MRNITLTLAAVAAMLVSRASALDIASIVVDLTPVTVVASQTVNVDVYEQAAYTGNTATFSVDEVCTALGIDDITAAQQYVVNVTDLAAATNTTDGWRDANGDLATWGTSDGMVCVKIQEPSSGLIDYIGFIDTSWTAWQTYTAVWAFVANSKAALVQVVITFVPLPDAPEAQTDLTKVTVVAEYEYTTECYASQEGEELECDFEVEGLAAALGLESSPLSLYFANDVYVQKYTDTNTLTLLDADCEGCVKKNGTQCYGTTNGNDLTFAELEYYYWEDEDEETGGTVLNEWVWFTVTSALEVFSVGDEVVTYLYVMNGDKAARIKHTFQMLPDKTMSEITVLGSQDITVEQYPTTDYSTSYFYPNVDEAAELLGCSTSDLELKALSNATTFATSYTAGSDGWYFAEDGYVGTWGSSSPFFILPYTTGDYSIMELGQMSGYCSAGDSYGTTIYLVYGSGAYQLNVTLNVVEKPEVNGDDLVVAATRNITVQQLLDTSYAWSDGESSSFDVLNSTIGTTSPTLYGTASDGSYSDDYSCSPYPGFWLTAEGYVTTWGNSSPWGVSTAVEASDEELIFNCIQLPGSTAVGDVYTTTLYLANIENNQMMQVNLTFKVVESLTEYVTVGELSITLPVSQDEYEVEVDLAPIAEALDLTEDELVDGMHLRAMQGVTTLTSGAAGLAFDTTGNAVAVSEGDFGFYFENGNILTWGNIDFEDAQRATSQACFEEDNLRYLLNLTFVSADEYTTPVTAVQAAPASQAIYDLSGRRVARAVKGVYIQGGAKILK